MRLLLAIGLFICLMGCYAKLSGRKRYLPNEVRVDYPIRLDGFYYSKENHDNPYDYSEARFFFKNGKTLDAGAIFRDNLKENNFDFTSVFFNTQLKDTLNTNYTNFKISGDTILFEQIYAWGSFEHHIFSGKIISKETFVLNQSKNVKNNKIETINDTFYFRYYPIEAYISDYIK